MRLRATEGDSGRPIVAETDAIRRVVTFHLNGLGDLLFTLPALRALRDALPRATITAVVRPALAPLLQDSPFLDAIVTRPRGLRGKRGLFSKLRAANADLAIAFSQSAPTILFARLTGAPLRVGFAGAHLPFLLTHRVPRQGPPALDRHLDLVRALGCPIPQHDYNGLVRVAPCYERRADALLAERGVAAGEPFLVAACEASEKRGIKEWPAGHWAGALRDLAASWPVVLVGTCAAPPALLDPRLGGGRIVDLGGRTDLPTLAALCGRARLCIGIDSGVLHLAAAMGVPVVGIFGPTDWRRTGPQGAAPHRIVRRDDVSCAPCLLSHCRWSGGEERHCLTRLPPDAVVRAARALLEA